jgi:hypothetical protein
MKKIVTRKLKAHRETIRELIDRQLISVLGGDASNDAATGDLGCASGKR